MTKETTAPAIVNPTVETTPKNILVIAASAKARMEMLSRFRVTKNGRTETLISVIDSIQEADLDTFRVILREVQNQELGEQVTIIRDIYSHSMRPMMNEPTGNIYGYGVTRGLIDPMGICEIRKDKVRLRDGVPMYPKFVQNPRTVVQECLVESVKRIVSTDGYKLAVERDETPVHGLVRVFLLKWVRQITRIPGLGRDGENGVKFGALVFDSQYQGVRLAQPLIGEMAKFLYPNMDKDAMARDSQSAIAD